MGQLRHNFKKDPASTFHLDYLYPNLNKYAHWPSLPQPAML